MTSKYVALITIGLVACTGYVPETEAARYASAAASCSVERLGAAPSMPTAHDVAARLAKA